MKTIPPLSTTCIGSVPFTDVDQTLELLARVCPHLPCWPQMVALSPREDMVLQAVDGLPLLEADVKQGRVVVSDRPREAALTEFYEHFLAGDWDHFAVPAEAGSGFPALLKRAAADPSFGPDFLKAQIIGPVSFGLSVRTPEGKTLLDDPDLADTVVKGLGAKAAWLAGRIRAVDRTPVIFLDEPGLTGLGSAFSNLERGQVRAMLDEAAGLARSGGETLVGTHICGNTDWGLVAECDLDIIDFDAYGYLDHFLLYPRELKAFLEKGGYVAWGIVPTRDFTGRETAEELAGRLSAGWAGLAGRGVDPDLIRRRTILTPSCGTGAISREFALAVHELLPRVAERLQG
ncbi:MAG: hypothetical protein AB1896_07185 [Thermodesulfobacteriota bacterium]